MPTGSETSSIIGVGGAGPSCSSQRHPPLSAVGEGECSVFQKVSYVVIAVEDCWSGAGGDLRDLGSVPTNSIGEIAVGIGSSAAVSVRRLPILS